MYFGEDFTSLLLWIQSAINIWLPFICQIQWMEIGEEKNPCWRFNFCMQCMYASEVWGKEAQKMWRMLNDDSIMGATSIFECANYKILF